MRLLSLFALSAFLFGANLSAHHEYAFDGDHSDMLYKCEHNKYHLKKMVFKHILLKHGVDEATAHDIIADIHALKMKIKHKVKKVLKAALLKYEGDEEGSHKACPYRLKRMIYGVLAKHGIEGEAADNVMLDVKHKIKNFLKHARGDE